MPRMQEPLRTKPLIEEEQSNYRRQASLTQSHNIYFIEGTMEEAKKPLKRYMGFMEVIPRIGETVTFFGVKQKLKIIDIEYSLKMGGGRPSIFIFLKSK
jgi:hypothetical protein